LYLDFCYSAKGFQTVGMAQGCRYFVDEVGLEVAVCVSDKGQEYGDVNQRFQPYFFIIVTAHLFALYIHRFTQ